MTANRITSNQLGLSLAEQFEFHRPSLISLCYWLPLLHRITNSITAMLSLNVSSGVEHGTRAAPTKKSHAQ
ncbi:hypothetical protein OUZ56_007631 [Daphnia magna]|uniref:Uncharacterized protein n=1 Tax=Daphnia magna TaxID=35525 RepID=A0ABR0AAV9_9CRUS|nr:hypothetical protein OUZ56_007631 [Daphnia magna]